MIKYTVSFLFNQNLTQVLLLLKDRGPYIGSYNGVGGKVEPTDKSLEEAAAREIKEETSTAARRLTWLMSMAFPGAIELHVYTGIVDPAMVNQMESEDLVWFDLDRVFGTTVTNTLFAGDGNVPYFVYSALLEMKKPVIRNC